MNPHGHKVVGRAPSTLTEKVQGVAKGVASGASAGFFDEFAGLGRAGLDYLLPNSSYDFGGGDAQDEQSFGDRYRTFRDDDRQSQRNFAENHPGLAIGSEIAGAIPSALISAPIAAGRGVAARTGASALAGGTAGYGYSDNPDTVGSDIALGGTLGMAGEPVAKGLGYLGSAVVNKIKRYGAKPAKAAAKELQRLAKQSGKTIDEIVEGIRNGNVMAENGTLVATIRGMRSMGGEAGDEIGSNVQARRDMTRGRAMRGLQDELAPDLDDPNVYRAMTRGDEELGRLENEAYSKVFAQGDDLPRSIGKQMLEIAAAAPGAKKSLDDIYRVEKLVPLFKTADNGAYEFARAPTLQDAEIMRRVIRDSSSEAYRNSQGRLGEGLNALRMGLQDQLDSFSPPLGKVRLAAAKRRQARDAFNEGRLSLGKPVDELVVILEDLKKNPEALAAYRAGAADAVRNRSKRSPSLMTRIADPDRQEGAAIRQMLPDGPQGKTLAMTEAAAAAEDARNKILHNSMTAPEKTATDFLKGGLSKSSLIGAGIDKVTKRLSNLYPDLPPEQQMEVVQYLYSTNADEVGRVLAGEYGLTQLQRMIGQASARTGTLGTMGNIERGKERD